MDCREAVLSNDYADFIYGYNANVFGDTVFPENFCTEQVAAGIGIYHAPIRSLQDLSVQNFNYGSFPKLYTTLDTSSMEASGVLRLINQPLLDLSGEGVLIGFIDTGIDYTNPVFNDEIGRSRIVGIWDQTDQSGTPPAGEFYGSEYNNNDINSALRNENPYEIVPERDENGHGTFAASIAAGRLDEANDFTGAAPKSSIAMVKLKEAKKYLKDFYFAEDNENVYQETDIMLGVKYLLNLQRELRMPMVIYIGLGTNNGGHTGATPLGYFLNYVSTTIGTAVVCAVGNEADSGHHFRGNADFEGDTSTVEVRVPAGVRGFSMELWAAAPEQYSVEIISPSGETSGRIPMRLGAGGEYRYILDRSRVFVDYQLLQVGVGSQLVLMRLETPSQGIWSIRVRNDYYIFGRFDIWLPAAGLVNDSVVFLKPDPDTTITIPSTAERVISVAAYNHLTGGIYLNSGRGYTRNNIIKPDITAPGVNIYGALPDRRFGRRSGTSVAAAHTAGVAALLLEWGILDGNVPLMTNGDVKILLIRGAKRSSDVYYPSPIWGYGVLDAYSALERLNR